MAKAIWTVYELVFQNKSYIGLTSCSLQDRLTAHIANSRQAGTKGYPVSPMQKAMKAAGDDLRSMISIHPIATCHTKEEGLAIEWASIKEKGTLTPRGWNRQDYASPPRDLVPGHTWYQRVVAAASGR